MSLTPCPACQTRIARRFGRGLCSRCYLDLSIRVCYPANPKYMPHADGNAAETLAPRQAGEALWWCIHCGRWRCAKPMQICGECEKEYRARAVDMPVEEVQTARPGWCVAKEAG